MIKLALIKNVLILARDLAELTLNVKCLIITPSVRVRRVILVILLLDARLSHVSVELSYEIITNYNFMLFIVYFIHFSETQAVSFEPKQPCVPSPCGMNAQCHDLGGVPSCSCLPQYFGSPPNCRPECTTNQDCISSKACINERCVDPCPGSCGQNAICNVINHVSMCTCLQGYQGDPFVGCILKPQQGKID